ncbi:DNA-deoxyinosine glycosylase [Aurantiacibacter sp. MUD61]|uniref:DNA-deoxyinosine glycosylase n=1 Tax=Aurantiacibacter sp. MUD61 TaxID=3009083 RepID=UPI0022F09FC6|nr:DNA-deoxyinosine glycosylase [Aurantiacibacter sp. MUD61]
MRKAAFPPQVAPHCRVLILGSLPGERSLAEQRYYAHPQNRFWHLVGSAVGRDLVSLNYVEKLAVLKRWGIGLWDVVASARREGSLDASIRDAEHNPLAELIGKLPQLQAVCFNGRTAAKIGRSQLSQSAITQIDLPSSSAAYARMPLGEKEDRWQILRDFLETSSVEAH